MVIEIVTQIILMNRAEMAVHLLGIEHSIQSPSPSHPVSDHTVRQTTAAVLVFRPLGIENFASLFGVGTMESHRLCRIGSIKLPSHHPLSEILAVTKLSLEITHTLFEQCIVARSVVAKRFSDRRQRIERLGVDACAHPVKCALAVAASNRLRSPVAEMGF